ncbi:MAG: dihydrofolate reductase family protein, partial [Chloroflexota bacterium]
QAQQVAGDKIVSISSASILQQCIKAGLQDEIILDVAPVLLGSGVRLFDNLDNFPLGLEQIGSVQGQGVTHLKYRVLK